MILLALKNFLLTEWRKNFFRIYNQFYDVTEDIEYTTKGQWLRQAVNRIYRIELKINTHQCKIFSDTMQVWWGIGIFEWCISWDSRFAFIVLDDWERCVRRTRWSWLVVVVVWGIGGSVPPRPPVSSIPLIFSFQSPLPHYFSDYDRECAAM